MITIRRAPVYATIQDIGRHGFRASGVPRAGAMDQPAYETLNALLGNSERAAMIECALTGGEIEIGEPILFAFGGADATVSINGRLVTHYRVHVSKPGDVIAIDTITCGRFLYIAFAGGIEVPEVMGSCSTYVPGGFGGFEGRRLKNGDVLQVSSVSRTRHHIAGTLPENLQPKRDNGTIRFIPRGSADELTLSEWKLSSSSDRTGYRLAGQGVIGGASITSEPVCPGVIQLPPGGEPIILMADAPTVGGYRILGTVITADLGRLAQLAPGDPVVLEKTTVEVAQREIVADAGRIEQVKEWTLG
ncbi:MAG TPA: biotin-dependent carboxyltransferase family protein [Gemmatimonadaceae bacterium]